MVTMSDAARRPRRASILAIAGALAWASLVAGASTAAAEAGRFAAPEDAVVAGVLDPAILDALRSGGEASAIASFDDGDLLARAGMLEAGGAARELIVAEIGIAADAVREAALAELAASGGEVLTAYGYLPAALVRISGEGQLMALLNRPEVTNVHGEVLVAPTTTESGPLVHQPQAVAMGYTGAGTSVGVVDTGVDYRRVAFGACTAPGTPATCRVAVSRDVAADDGTVDDASLHGTNVSGIAAAMAPGARLVVQDVIRADGTATSSDIMRAIDWLIGNAAGYNVRAVNLSLGSGSYSTGCPPDPGFRVSMAAGIVPVVAAGNGGQTSGVAWPACVAEAIAVGAVYDASVGARAYGICSDASTAPDRVACFSQTGPSLDLLAPGAIITAAGISMAGTSQAAPHVAAAAAMLASLSPEAAAADIGDALVQTGPLITDPRTGVATHRLDIQAAGSALQVHAGADPSAPAEPPPSSQSGGHPFTDIDATPFEGDILWIYERGITRGCASTLFCPADFVLRDQMASFLVRAFQLPPTSLDFFADDDGNMHESNINRVAAAGVSLGCATGRYCPSAPVTREQMASFLLRGLNYAGRPVAPTPSDHFVDDDGSVHEADINRLASAGITRGCRAWEFCPRLVVTREQMAAFLRRSLD